MIKGRATFNSKSDDFIKKAIKETDKATQKAFKVAERNIKLLTPVDTGNLKRSITSRRTGMMAAEVFTEANYAFFVEYGTRYMAPRAMFRRGIEASRGDINRIYEDHLQNVRLHRLKSAITGR